MDYKRVEVIINNVNLFYSYNFSTIYYSNKFLEHLANVKQAIADSLTHFFDQENFPESVAAKYEKIFFILFDQFNMAAMFFI